MTVRNAVTGESTSTIIPRGVMQIAVIRSALSRDGRRLATTGGDNAARVWETGTGKLLTGALRHREELRCFGFRGDDLLLATGSDDKTARVWDTQTGEAASPPLPHTAGLIFVGFCAEGRQLVSVSADAVIRRWPLDDDRSTEELLRQARIASGQTVDQADELVPVNIQREWAEESARRDRLRAEATSRWQKSQGIGAFSRKARAASATASRRVLQNVVAVGFAIVYAVRPTSGLRENTTEVTPMAVRKKPAAKPSNARKVKGPTLLAASPTPPTLTATKQGHNVSLQLESQVVISALGPYQIDVNLVAYKGDAGGPVVASGAASFVVNGLGFPVFVPLQLNVLQYAPSNGNYRLMGDISGTDASGTDADLGYGQITYSVP